MRNPCLRLLKAILGNWTWSQWRRFKQNWGVSASEAGSDRDPWATWILKSLWNLGNFKQYCGCWKKPWATKFVQRVPEKKLALGHLVLNCCDYHMHIYGAQWIKWTAKKGKTSILWPGWMEWVHGKELFGPFLSSAQTWCQKHQDVEDCKAAAGQWSSCWGGVSGMSWASGDAVSTHRHYAVL